MSEHRGIPDRPPEGLILGAGRPAEGAKIEGVSVAQTIHHNQSYAVMGQGGIVRVLFGHPAITELGLTPDEAYGLASKLLKHADRQAGKSGSGMPRLTQNRRDPEY